MTKIYESLLEGDEMTSFKFEAEEVQFVRHFFFLLYFQLVTHSSPACRVFYGCTATSTLCLLCVRRRNLTMSMANLLSIVLLLVQFIKITSISIDFFSLLGDDCETLPSFGCIAFLHDDFSHHSGREHYDDDDIAK